MKYQIVCPSQQLSKLVSYFWIYEGTAEKTSPFVIRTFACGFPELIFHYQGIFSESLSNDTQISSFKAGVHSQTSRYRDFTTSENFGMIGVHLHPYALKALFNIPTVEFTNQLPDLDSILRPGEENIQQRVFDAKDNIERISVISEFIRSRVQQDIRPEVCYAVKKIVERNGNINARALADECNFSQRQFERLFKDHTGFSAKSFSRLIRFNHLINHADAEKQSLTQIALDFGYYDQSHFIGDFKQFTGHTPTGYFANRKAFA